MQNQDMGRTTLPPEEAGGPSMLSSSLGAQVLMVCGGICLVSASRLPSISLFPKSHFIFCYEVTVIGLQGNPDKAGIPHLKTLS